MSDHPDATILEIYKLAVELADRVTARRAGANAFFMTANGAVVAALGFLSSTKPAPLDRYTFALCVVGIALNAAWWVLLRSFRDLNAAKFSVIINLEASLPVAIFKDEWTELKKDPVKRWRPGYAEFGTVEKLAPYLFGAVFVVLGAAML